MDFLSARDMSGENIKRAFPLFDENTDPTSNDQSTFKKKDQQQ